MSKLTDKAKDLIKYMPEAVNQLAESICGAFDNAILHGAKTTTTNADRIRAMTDEELADWLTFVEQKILKNQPTLDRSALYEDWLDWLRQEAAHA